MAIEQEKWIDITKTLSWTIWNFSKTLKNFMNDLMWPINKLLEERWIKEKKEVNNELNKTKLDLKKLMNDVNLKVKIDNKLSEDEKEIIKEVKEKNKKLKWILDRVKKEFWNEAMNREGNLFIHMLKEETDWWEIEQSELNKIIENMDKNKEKIEKDNKLKDIITKISEDDEIKEKPTLDKIVTIYKEIRKEKGDDIEITKKMILEKMS